MNNDFNFESKLRESIETERMIPYNEKNWEELSLLLDKQQSKPSSYLRLGWLLFLPLLFWNMYLQHEVSTLKHKTQATTTKSMIYDTTYQKHTVYTFDTIVIRKYKESYINDAKHQIQALTNELLQLKGAYENQLSLLKTQASNLIPPHTSSANAFSSQREHIANNPSTPTDSLTLSQLGQTDKNIINTDSLENKTLDVASKATVQDTISEKKEIEAAQNEKEITKKRIKLIKPSAIYLDGGTTFIKTFNEKTWGLGGAVRLFPRLELLVGFQNVQLFGDEESTMVPKPWPTPVPLNTEDVFHHSYLYAERIQIPIGLRYQLANNRKIFIPYVAAGLQFQKKTKEVLEYEFTRKNGDEYKMLVTPNSPVKSTKMYFQVGLETSIYKNWSLYLQSEINEYLKASERLGYLNYSGKAGIRFNF